MARLKAFRAFVACECSVVARSLQRQHLWVVEVTARRELFHGRSRASASTEGEVSQDGHAFPQSLAHT